MILSLKEAAAQFLQCRTIAVVGVRSSRQDAADGIYDALQKKGYHLYPVNPKMQQYKNTVCYPSVAAIAEPVEAVLIVLQPKNILPVVEDCHRKKVKYIWMHKSFGDSVSEEAVQYCHRNGITVLPGGCPMMFIEGADPFHRAFNWVFRVTGRIPHDVVVYEEGAVK